MKNKILAILIILIMIPTLFACKSETKETKSDVKDSVVENITRKIVMSGPKAPPTIPMLRMIETQALGEDVEIEFKIWNGVEELLALASSDDYGFLAVPVNTGAKLKNKGMKLKLTNVNTWGVIYLATTDPLFEKWEDLKGKKLYVAFKSAPPDIITQYMLSEHGLEVGKDVELVYSTPSEIAQMAKANQLEYFVNIEPFVTASKMGNKDLRVVFDYMQEWKKLKGENYDFPNAGIVTNEKFLKTNEDLVEKFEKEYEIAVKWTLENPEEAGELVEKHLGLNKDLIQNALPTLGLKYKSTEDAKEDLLEYYNTLLESNPESIGGKTPDEEYYYQSK